MIPVTKPYLPSREKYNNLVSDIWERQWLTNHGPLVNELEVKLRDYIANPYLSLVSNGTIALQIAIKALELKGEIITTPFSYVATTSSIVWEQCSPVFADIESRTFNIDPAEIEKKITNETSAILATHVFGNPCDIATISEIAQKYNLKVIYDAAHCFGTKYNGESIFNYGDISTCSFHATKLFHTTEGGAVICNDDSLYDKILLLRNFGHTSPITFGDVGINGKNSEFHAAMGLCCFEDLPEILAKRKAQWQYYYESLTNQERIQLVEINSNTEYNYSYFPIVFDSEEALLKVLGALNSNYIIPRRYFYPSLNTLDYLIKSSSCPISESISARIICLPLFHSLKIHEQDLVISIIKKHLS